MNIYYKLKGTPVFLAECGEEHEKGSVITVTTKQGDEHDCIVHNLAMIRNGKHYYSITRENGYDNRERAKNKADRLREWAESAERRSDEYYSRANKDSEFLSLGEPIKVGHHSEKRHRRALDQAQSNATRSIDMMQKAKTHREKATKYDNKTRIIDLSMPDSVEYYAKKLNEAKEYHADLKANPGKREHSYSLTYAKKAVNGMDKKYQLAIKLWG